MENSEISSRKIVKTKKDAQIIAIENQLREKMGVQVEINHLNTKKSGKIILKYSNLEVLDGILEKMDYEK
jgi:hypothetical protein